MPDRYDSLADVLANTIGLAAGSLCAQDRANESSDRRPMVTCMECSPFMIENCVHEMVPPTTFEVPVLAKVGFAPHSQFLEYVG